MGVGIGIVIGDSDRQIGDVFLGGYAKNEIGLQILVLLLELA
jgi:hypothetical protein